MFIYDLCGAEHSRELIDELYSVSEVIPTGTQPDEKKTAIAAQLFEIHADILGDTPMFDLNTFEK